MLEIVIRSPLNIYKEDAMFESREFFVAGVQYHELKRCIRQLKNGDSLSLTLEPSNKYDPNAVRIEFNDVDNQYQIGYIPKKFSSEISAAIEVGIKVGCKIIELNPSAKPWEQCLVRLYDSDDPAEYMNEEGTEDA